jgi:hypothetical protein
MLMQPIAAVWVHAHPLTAGLVRSSRVRQSLPDFAAKAMLARP